MICCNDVVKVDVLRVNVVKVDVLHVDVVIVDSLSIGASIIFNMGVVRSCEVPASRVWRAHHGGRELIRMYHAVDCS